MGKMAFIFVFSCRKVKIIMKIQTGELFLQASVIRIMYGHLYGKKKSLQTCGPRPPGTSYFMDKEAFADQQELVPGTVDTSEHSRDYRLWPSFRTTPPARWAATPDSCDNPYTPLRRTSLLKASKKHSQKFRFDKEKTPQIEEP